MASEPSILSIMRAERASWLHAGARVGLSVLSLGYRLGVAVRGEGYRLGLLPVRLLPRPVISIGNLTTGGTGKTPTVLHVCRFLIAQGVRPCVLMRGYGSEPGRPETSDEAQELAEALGGHGRVMAHPDRYKAGLRALGEDPAIGCFVLDDGFQHRRLYRNLDLVLVDAAMHPGYAHLLPRGLFRESPSGLKRAHGVLITRSDQADRGFGGSLAGVDAWVQKHHAGPAVAHAFHKWEGLLDAEDAPVPVARLASATRLVACTGLGNPQAFYDQLSVQAPVAQVTKVTLPDHFRFGSLQALEERVLILAREQGCPVVTTEKDWVKWRPLLAGESGCEIWRPRLTLGFKDGETELEDLILGAIGRR